MKRTLLDIFLFLISIVLIYISLYITNIFSWFIENEHSALFFLLKTLIFIFSSITILLLFNSLLKKIGNHNWLKNLLTSFVFLILSFGLAELIFTFIPISSHDQTSLSSWTWEAYYGKRNAPKLIKKGANNLSPNQTITFIGDSFTEGYGLKQRKNRFTDLVAKKLSDNYDIYNYGRNGIGTEEEFYFFKRISHEIDIVIIQYFFNDIVTKCIKEIGPAPEFDAYKSLNISSRWLVTRSHLLNYLFHKYSKKTSYDDYMIFFDTCFSNDTVVQEYYKLLKEINDYCKQKDFDLVFLIVPNNINPSDSQKSDNVVINFLKELEIPVLNLTETILELQIEDRIVNKHDIHFSKAASLLVSDTIVNFLLHSGIVNQ